MFRHGCIERKIIEMSNGRRIDGFGRSVYVERITNNGQCSRRCLLIPGSLINKKEFLDNNGK